MLAKWSSAQSCASAFSLGPRCLTPAGSEAGVRRSVPPPSKSLFFSQFSAAASASLSAERGARSFCWGEGRGGEGCAKSAPESSGGVHGCSKLRARPGQRGDPAARPRRPVALRTADGGGGRVVGTDTTHLLCLAGSQSRARPGGRSGSHFMVPGPTSCPQSFGISTCGGLGLK